MSEMEGRILFTEAELGEAVFEVMSSRRSQSDYSSSEPLVQEIYDTSAPDPEVKIIKDDVQQQQSLAGTDLLLPSGSQTQFNTKGSVGFEAANVTATFQSGGPRLVLVSHDDDGTPHSMPVKQKGPSVTIANLRSLTKRTKASASIPKSPHMMHPVLNRPVENWKEVVHTTGTKFKVNFVTQTNEGLLVPAPVLPCKWRVAAVNSQGKGPWSEAVVHKTTEPRLPGTPQQAKLFRIAEGVKLTWEEPRVQNGPILEYSVYLAIPPIQTARILKRENDSEMGKIRLKRVYCGAARECIVSNWSLKDAFVDTSFGTGRPAMIFRIAARNAQSYGPAMQVRWVRDIANGNN